MLTDRERRRRLVKQQAHRTRYGRRHRMTRALLSPLVQAGVVDCARCGEPIEPGTRWDLGHQDENPSVYSGPEHGWCNQTAPHRNKTSRQW
jgi:hypothetical protein